LENKKRRIFLVLAILFLIIELVLLIPDLMKVEAEPADSRCCENLKRIDEALEKYRKRHLGKYPETLNDLVPYYIGKIPKCEKADTHLHYVNSYTVSEDYHSYTINCRCSRHPITGKRLNYPRYNSDRGLIVKP